jgi:hypothetical protein
MSANSENNRRAFLKKLLGGAGMASMNPIDMFLGNMMVHFMQNGLAHAAGEDPLGDMKLINLQVGGGIPSYLWDNPMRPNGNDTFVANPFVASRFVNGQPVYATTKIGDFHFSSLWDSNIPTADGGVVSMKQLAQNMMFIRGINLQIDDHGICSIKHITPVLGAPSISGLAADQAVTAIPSTGNGGGGARFRSAKGIMHVEATGSNPFTRILTPFMPITGLNMLTTRGGGVEAAIDEALARMNKVAGEDHKFLPGTYETRQNAKYLMKKSFGNLQLAYNDLVAKYRTLISRALLSTGNLSLAGLDNVTLPGAKTNFFLWDRSNHYTGANLMDSMTSTSSISSLAEGMAIAEFMILEGYSSVAYIRSSGLTNLLFSEMTDSLGAITSNFKAGFVMDGGHFTGSHICTFLYTRYYKAMAACLYELTQRIKSTQTSKGNLFDQTVMTITTDFNRSPMANGAHCDHGWNASHYTILSGMFEAPIVRGNIRTVTGSRAGTWGVAAGVPELYGRETLIGNAASTVCTLLGVNSPTPNDRSFVEVDPATGKARATINSCNNL